MSYGKHDNDERAAWPLGQSQGLIRPIGGMTDRRPSVIEVHFRSSDTVPHSAFEAVPLLAKATLKMGKASNDLADAAYALDAQQVRVVEEADL